MLVSSASIDIAFRFALGRRQWNREQRKSLGLDCKASTKNTDKAITSPSLTRLSLFLLPPPLNNPLPHSHLASFRSLEKSHHQSTLNSADRLLQGASNPPYTQPPYSRSKSAHPRAKYTAGGSKLPRTLRNHNVSTSPCAPAAGGKLLPVLHAPCELHPRPDGGESSDG